MYRGMFGVVLLVLAGSASAQQVYKCVNGKQVSYQSAPCPGQAQKAWDATPQAVDPYVEARIEAMRQQQAQRTVISSSSGGRSTAHSVSQAANRSRCEQARADRARAYEVAGTRRSFAMSSRWDGIVQNACK